MSTAETEHYFVIPLSVQRERDDFLVGNADIDEFYHFPEVAVRIIDHLREGAGVDEIKSRLQASAEEDEQSVDVDDFIEQLKDIGFIYPPAERARFDSAVAETGRGDRRLLFKAPTALARAVFSLPVSAIYLSVLGYAAFAAIGDPALRLNLNAFYIEDQMTLTLVSLLALYIFTASLHELGHMLAAARYGVSSRLGIGNRLWMVVAEADLTGILSLPQRQRYLPLLAGMLTDLLSIALITLLIRALLQSGYDGFSIQLLQALILQILISISWQFNIFVKTDVYYVVCNHYGHRDLDLDARAYLRDRIHALSFGRFGARAAPFDPSMKNILRTFAWIWIAGRVGALFFLVLVLIPTLVLYFKRAYLVFSDPGAASGAAFDALSFAVISALLFAFGMYLWLRRKPVS